MSDSVVPESAVRKSAMEGLYCRTCGAYSGEMDDASLVVRRACQCEGPDVYGLDRMTARAFLWDGIRTFFTCVSWAIEERAAWVTYRDSVRDRPRLLAMAEESVEIAERALEALRQKEAARQGAP